jgi:superoxide dismutase, Cu-Zn family
MQKPDSSIKLGLLLILGASITTGCNSDTKGESGGKMLATSSGPWTVFPDPYAPMSPGMPNPITSSIGGTATGFDMGGKLKITLAMTGLPPNREFGAHLHKKACTDEKAGGHYQNNMWPDGSSPTDPMYANNDNEVWLDFTTDATGKGGNTRMVEWLPRPGQAKAIIIHHMKTGTGGAAGARLACMPLEF